jgi:hypothetical protein
MLRLTSTNTDYNNTFSQWYCTKVFCGTNKDTWSLQRIITDSQKHTNACQGFTSSNSKLNWSVLTNKNTSSEFVWLRLCSWTDYNLTIAKKIIIMPKACIPRFMSSYVKLYNLQTLTQITTYKISHFLSQKRKLKDGGQDNFKNNLYFFTEDTPCVVNGLKLFHAWS